MTLKDTSPQRKRVSTCSRQLLPARHLPSARQFASLLLLVLLCISPVISFAAEKEAKPKEKRNVVLIVADDLGMQIGCYGDKVIKTPSLDALAASGTRFTQSYCTTASCSASRSVILTGLQNHFNGQYGHEHGQGHFRTFDRVRSLPVVMGEAGYRTCSIGKFHVGPEKVYHFQQYLNKGVQGNRNTAQMAKNAKDFITEKDDRPFFLYFCTSDPHRGAGPDKFSNYHDDPDHYPGTPRVTYDASAIDIPSWLPNSDEARQELMEYYQAISRVDYGVGQLMQTLKETGNDKNTLVLFLSDNGPPFPGAKTNLYEPGMRLPLIVRNPLNQEVGQTTAARVTWADLAPTIYDFAKVEAPKGLHGRSFLKAMQEPDPKGWEDAYASHTFHEITMYYPMRIILQGKYKYILNVAYQLPYPFASDLYASPTWQGVLKRKEKYYGLRPVETYIHRPQHELYDLEADPDEIHNLAKDPDYAEILSKLQANLKAWQKKTGDPWIVKYTYE